MNKYLTMFFTNCTKYVVIIPFILPKVFKAYTLVFRSRDGNAQSHYVLKEHFKDVYFDVTQPI